MYDGTEELKVRNTEQVNKKKTAGEGSDVIPTMARVSRIHSVHRARVLTRHSQWTEQLIVWNKADLSPACYLDHISSPLC